MNINLGQKTLKKKMQPGLFSTFNKIFYAPCKSKDHNGEILSLACVDKTF